MAYAPGSFSKNFAWHGTGLRKLHTTVRNGFNEILSPVDRQMFRSKAGINSSIILIPINFFLHNANGKISVDELVFQAIKRDHSRRFDRLTLFALNLSRVGGGRDSLSRREIVSRPAMWANEFVRERLWSHGVWETDKLLEASLDQFLAERMDAQQRVRVKCRSNYRHIFELCGYFQSNRSVINSSAEQWIGPALFLTWDRHILDGGADDKPSLLNLIDSDEIYKLLGVARGDALAQAESFVDLYISCDGLRRFNEAVVDPLPELITPTRSANLVLESNNLEWLEQEQSDTAVERRSAKTKHQVRNRKKAAVLKRHYGNTCQFCGTRLQVSDGQYYSEAAHIKGLGEPHNGPDNTNNMLVLCPNHHLQFDRGVLRLRNVGTDYQVQSEVKGDHLDGKKITLTHILEDEYVRYHYNWFG